MKNLVITFDSFIYEEQLTDFIKEFDNIDFLLVEDEMYIYTVDFRKYDKVLVFESSISVEFKEELEYLGLYDDVEVKYFKSYELFYILNNCYNLTGGC